MLFYTLIFSSDLNCGSACFCLRTAPRTTQLGGNPARLILRCHSRERFGTNRSHEPQRLPASEAERQSNHRRVAAAAAARSNCSSLHSSKLMLSPARNHHPIGSLHSDGSPTRSSPHKSRRAESLSTSSGEAQRRQQPSELRQVQIHDDHAR